MKSCLLPGAAGLILATFLCTPLFAYSGGSGTSGDPYQIGSVADWSQLMNTASDWGKCFVLINDINLAGASLTSVGRLDSGCTFTGIFDGNGRSLINATINDSASSAGYYGVFAWVGGGGQIRNLGLKNVVVSITGSSAIVGALCGENDGTLTNCYATGSVAGKWDVGGLCGDNHGTITGCYSTASATGNNVGGLCGLNDGTISECYATGNVSGTGILSCAGGLCGETWSSSIIDRCYATGSVSGDYVGGLCAGNHGAISNCYATGTVMSDGYNAGGLCGVNGDTISNCYATGIVSGSPAGGLCGSTVAIEAIRDSFWDVTTSGLSSSAGGTGKTTAQMKTKTTFTSAGWDFVSVWRMPANGYPLLADISAPLSVTTASLAGGTVGQAYSQTLVAAGGTPPYGWTVSGGSLPTGLTLSLSGTIHGTPMAAGTSNFTARVADAQSATAIKALSIAISSATAKHITVISPNGGEKWPAGSNRTITWDSNAGGNVKIELLNAGISVLTIASTTPNNNSYAWTIPANQVADTGYKIRISSTADISIRDTSNSAFSITQANDSVLDVSAGDLVSSGPYGGPFSLASKTYILTNEGNGTLQFAVTKAEPWVTLSPVSGTLQGKQYTPVTVTINDKAKTLSSGTYSDTIIFANRTNGSGNAIRKATVTVAEIDSVKVGLLTLTADSIVASGSNYRLTGNVKINGLLCCSNTVTADTATRTVKGNGLLYLKDVPRIGQVSLYEGPFALSGDVTVINCTKGAKSLLKVGGLDVAIRTIAIENNALVVKGSIAIKGPWGSVSVDVASNDNYISVSRTAGLQVVGVVRVTKIKIPNSGFVLRNGALVFDTAKNTFGGQFDVGFPTGVTLQSDVLVEQGMLTSIGFGVDNSHEPFYKQPMLLQTPPIYLQGVYGRLQWDKDLTKIAFTTRRVDGSDLGLSLTAGPSFVIADKTYFAVKGLLSCTIDTTGYLQGRGTLWLFNEDLQMATAAVTLDPAKGFLIEGEISCFDIVTADAKLKLDWKNNFQGTMEGKFTAPEDWPVIGGLQFGNVRFYCDNDFMIAGLQVSTEATIAVKLDKYGKWHFPADLDEIKTVSFAQRALRAAASSQSCEVPDGMNLVVFRLTWSAGDTDFSLIAPDGSRYTPVLTTPSGTAVYLKNAAAMEACYLVSSPQPGAWQFDIAQPQTIGSYQITMFGGRPAPSVEVLSPAGDVTSDRSVPIQWQCSDPSGQAKISLYWDTNDSGCAGTLIVSDIPVSGGTGSYTWQTSGLGAGNYHVFAKISDGVHPPSCSYAGGTVTVINKAAPMAPANVCAVAGDGGIALSWDESPEADLLTYRVYFTDELANPGYKNSLDAGADASFSIDNLKNGTMYRFCVTAIDGKFNESAMSQAVYATPLNGSNNAPCITSTPGRYGRVGRVYTYHLIAGDVDDDAVTFSLSSKPAGADISASGDVSWTPSGSQLGNNRFAVDAADGKDGHAQQSFTVTIAAPLEGNLPPSFVDGPPLAVGIGKICRWTVTATDPDGDSVTCALRSGPEGMEFDPVTKEVFWIPRRSQEGMQRATFEAVDGRGAKTSREFAICVKSEELTAESFLAVKKLQIQRRPKKPGSDGFVLTASFNTCGKGVNWVSNAVMIDVGPYSATLAGGSLQTKDGTVFKYSAPKGTASGISFAQVNLKKRTLNLGAKNVDLSSLGPNVRVRLRIGDYDSSTYVSVQPKNPYVFNSASQTLTGVMMVDLAQFTVNSQQVYSDGFVIQGLMASPARLQLESEQVTIGVGAQSWLLKPGTFVKTGSGDSYMYRGGPSSQLSCVQFDLRKGTFRIVGQNLNLRDLPNSVEVSMDAGLFAGTVTIDLQKTPKGFGY